MLRPGETDEAASILQGIRVLLATRRGSVPLYRDFGLTMEYLDKPLPVAQALIAAELAEAVGRFEPRAKLAGVTVRPDSKEPSRLFVEYEFFPADEETLVAELVADYERRMGISVQPSSVDRLLIQWAAHALLIERVRANHIGNQNLPSRAEGENLDELAQLFSGLHRPDAKAAQSAFSFLRHSKRRYSSRRAHVSQM